MVEHQRSVFGILLKEMRQAAALSQEELAERAGISARGISDLERGARTTPRPETMRMLADGLGLDADLRERFYSSRSAGSASVPLSTSRRMLLPIPVTSFIGRNSELGEIQRALDQPEVRLLTLTGSGGVGKTRIAIETAHLLKSHYPDGAVFVDLSAVNDPARVLPAIASRLGIAMQRDVELSNVLATVLRREQLLLILDNFEQVIDAAADIAVLLNDCPGIKIIVTSRIRLRIAAEHVYTVDPFAVSVDREGEAPEDSDAINLFVARTKAQDENYAFDSHSLHLVSSIVNRLEGMPLAIELAAARTRLVDLAGLNRLLESQLPVLGYGVRDGPGRHTTIRETIKWSYQLLTPIEQAVLRTISVFVEGCTLATAIAVGREHLGLAEDELMESLQVLIDSSLLRRFPGRDGEPRFRMLATVREFCLEQVHTIDEEARIRHAIHTSWAIQLVVGVDRLLARPDIVSILMRLDAEIRNLNDHISWLKDAGELESALRLATGINSYRSERGQFAEAMVELETLLAHAQCQEPGSSRLHGLIQLTGLHCSLGNNHRALELASEAVALARSLGDQWALACGLIWYGLASNLVNQSVLNEDYYKEAQGIAQSIDDTFLIAHTYHFMAFTRFSRGDYVAAKSLNRKSIILYESIGSIAGAVLGKGNLVCCHLVQQEIDAAEALAQECVDMFVTLGIHRCVPLAYMDLADIARIRNDYGEAERLLHLGIKVSRETGDVRSLAHILVNMANLAMITGRPAEAQTFTNEAMFLFDRSGNRTEMLQCVDVLADIALSDGDGVRAATLVAAVDESLCRNGMRRLEVLPNQHFDRIASTASMINQDLWLQSIERGRGWSDEDILREMRRVYMRDWPLPAGVSVDPETAA